MELKEEEKKIILDGEVYEPLADGEYDVCILGTGLKECVLGSLLQQKGMKVLQIDRNPYYGADLASLNLTNLLKISGVQMEKRHDKYPGRNRDYNVDLIPKFLMACGDLVEKFSYILKSRGTLSLRAYQGATSIKTAVR